MEDVIASIMREFPSIMTDQLVRMKLAPEIMAINIPSPRQSSSPVALVVEKLSRACGQLAEAYGSQVNGFGDETSDIDVTIPEWRGDRLFDAHVVDAIKRAGFDVKEQRPFARVPLLLLQYHYDGQTVDVDLCAGNNLGIKNSQLLRAYVDMLPELADFACNVRNWAKDQGIYGPTDGLLSSYTLNILVEEKNLEVGKID